MSIITKGANGRLIHGWTKEQADQEIEKGVLSQSDVIFLESESQIYAFKKFWGGSGGTGGGDTQYLDITSLFELNHLDNPLSDETIEAVRKAFQGHVTTALLSIPQSLGEIYTPMEILKFPEANVSSHEVYAIVLSITLMEEMAEDNETGFKLNSYSTNVFAFICDTTDKQYHIVEGTTTFRLDGIGTKFLADDGVYHEINVDTTEITNKLNTLTSDVNTLKTDVANLKTEVNGASAALTELEEASK